MILEEKFENFIISAHELIKIFLNSEKFALSQKIRQNSYKTLAEIETFKFASEKLKYTYLRSIDRCITV